MQNVTFDYEPSKIEYMPLPDGSADVWLRQNISRSDDEGWSADEVYFRTSMSRADIEANFDTLFGRDELLTDSKDVETRIADLEEAMNLILTGATE